MTRRYSHASAALASLLCWAGCTTPTASPQSVAAGDAELYASYVQPYVEVSCATLDCHGDPGRALRLYSELGLRSEPSLRPSPLAEHNEPLAITAAELEANRFAFAAVALATSTPEDHLALLKPLAISEGGIHHKGGVHWPNREADGYLCLRGYVLGDAAEDVAQRCADALDALARP